MLTRKDQAEIRKIIHRDMDKLEDYANETLEDTIDASDALSEGSHNPLSSKTRIERLVYARKVFFRG